MGEHSQHHPGVPVQGAGKARQGVSGHGWGLCVGQMGRAVVGMQVIKVSVCAGRDRAQWCQAAGSAHQDLLLLPPRRGEVSPRKGGAAASLAWFCVTRSLQELPPVVLGLSLRQAAAGSAGGSRLMGDFWISRCCGVLPQEDGSSRVGV